MMRMGRTLAGLALVAAALTITLAAPGFAQAQPLPRTLTPHAQRITDEAIARDLGAIDGWSARLDSVLAEPGPHDAYRAAAARKWLAAARNEYTDRDRQGFAESAFARSLADLDALIAHATPYTNETVPTATVVQGSTKVHDELWSTLEKLKRDPGYPCAAEEIARMEVQLAWAGNEQLDQGDCNTSPHLADAQDLARTAAQKEATCNATPLPVEPKLLPVTPPKPAMPTREELTIPRNVHFALDKHSISAGSRKVIAGIAALLQKYPSIRVRLVGHTDSRASVDYNLLLSERRVRATERAFRELGVDSTRMSLDWKGKSELTSEEADKRGFALNRRVEMVFVDPDGRDITSQAQEGDLQLEGDKHRVRTPVKKAPAGGAPKPGLKKPRATPVKPRP